MVMATLDDYSNHKPRTIFKHIIPAMYKMLSSLQYVNTINHSIFSVIKLQKLTFSRIS